MARERKNIVLTDEFNKVEWADYMSFDAATEKQLPFQKHVDIRTFHPEGEEGWSNGSVVWVNNKGASLVRVPALELALVANKTVATESITLGHTVDLLTGFESTDTIALTYEAPGSLKELYLEFTSSKNASFYEETAVLHSQNSKSVGAGSTLVWNRSELENKGVNLEAITGVRIRVFNGGSETKRIFSLRLIKGNYVASSTPTEAWTVPTNDFDNWNKRYRWVPSFAPKSEEAKFTQGIIWRAASFSGADDPMIVDGEFQVNFYIGAKENSNSISLYFREQAGIIQNQVDLLGLPMSALDGQPQPDLGERSFQPRPMSEFDDVEVEELDRQTMEAMDRRNVPDPEDVSWCYAEVLWGEKGTQVRLGNSTTTEYEFLNKFEFEANSRYTMRVSLEKYTMRAIIYKRNSDGSLIQTPVYDTGTVNDDNEFRRAKGRWGWKSKLEDHENYISSIRPIWTSYAEYQSAPLTSFTPVSGARLYAAFTPNTEIWEGGIGQYPVGSTDAVATTDEVRTLTEYSNKIVTKGVVNQGFETESFEINNWEQTEIHCAVWFNGTARGENEEEQTVENLAAYLVNDKGTTFLLTLPELIPNQWQKMVIRMPTTATPAGKYHFRLVQQTTTPATWWLDEIKIFTRSVEWAARSVTEDPWESTFAPWLPLRDMLNSPTAGASFHPQGTELQMRARALRQDATIHKPEILPQYAQLGRFVWGEEPGITTTGPTAKFEPENLTEVEYNFKDESTAGSGAIVAREWTLGDGASVFGNSLSVKHTYAEAGEFTVTLTAIDIYGNVSKFEKAVTPR